MAGVGTNKVFENDKVNVWELFLAPGAKHELHTHELEYVFYVTQGSTARIFDADGKEVGVVEAHAGEVFSLRREGDEFVSGSGADELRVPATHSVENIGDSEYREILVEFKA